MIFIRFSSSAISYLGWLCGRDFIYGSLAQIQGPWSNPTHWFGHRPSGFCQLNKIEWILFAWYCGFNVPFKRLLSAGKIALILVGLVLILQTIWLLPALDARAELYITGATVPSSNAHWYDVVAERIKMISLITLGISLFDQSVARA